MVCFVCNYIITGNHFQHTQCRCVYLWKWSKRTDCLLQTNDDKDASDDDESIETGCTLFVKNLNFSTTEDALKQVSSEIFCGNFVIWVYTVIWLYDIVFIKQWNRFLDIFCVNAEDLSGVAYHLQKGRKLSWLCAVASREFFQACIAVPSNRCMNGFPLRSLPHCRMMQRTSLLWTAFLFLFCRFLRYFELARVKSYKHGLRDGRLC